MRESLDIWPPFSLPFPIAIQYSNYNTFTLYDADNLLAALENHGRVSQVDLYLTGLQLGEVATVIQQPFPALTHLALRWAREDERPPVLPSDFLGGSSPCLRHIHLKGILFPALPSLLLSTSGVVDLHLGDIHQEGSISAEAMVACLAGLPRLKSLSIEFQLATFLPGQITLPRMTRTLLPALTSIRFLGACEYMEELVSRIDSPRLGQIYISYLNQLRDFQLAQLFKFIDRSEDPAISLIRYADVTFSGYSVNFKMSESSPYGSRVAVVVICQPTERQVSLIAQAFSQPSAMLSRVVHHKLSHLQFAVSVGLHRDEWLLRLRQFSTIRTLHVSQKFRFVWYIAVVLEGVTGEMVVEILPVVDFIYLGGEPVSHVEKFLAVRQLSSYPLIIVDTEVEFDERIESYAR